MNPVGFAQNLLKKRVIFSPILRTTGLIHRRVAVLRVPRTLRFYTQEVPPKPAHAQPSPAKHIPTPTPKHAVGPTPPPPRHEAHERNLDINVPFNPPGGGGGPGIGGSGSSFNMTGSPLADAALTTIIGLGLGECNIHGARAITNSG